MTSSSSKPDPFAALSEQNYRYFLSGWLPAATGLMMQGTALAWEVYERTGDPLALGIVGLARTLPTVVLALPAGRIVDLVDRRRVLVATQIGFAIAGIFLMFGSMAWEYGFLGDGSTGLWVTYFFVALTGLARVFNNPSRSSLLPLLFRGGTMGLTFHNAVTWNTGAFQLSAMLGPLIAGGMIAATGHAWPVYLVTAISCLWFAFTARCIRPYEQKLETVRSPLSLFQLVRPSIIMPGILEGVHHIRRERTVFGAIVLDLFAVLLGGATALMPIYAKDILHVGPVGLGLLRAAPFLGAVGMAIVLALRAPFQNAGPTFLWAVTGFGFCTIVFGLSTNFWLSMAMLITLGALDNISVVIRNVLVSVRTPDHLRGRVSAVNAVFIECSNELGGFESGLVAKFFGPVFSVVFGGFGTLFVVAAMARWIPELRRLKRLDLEEVQRVDAS